MDDNQKKVYSEVYAVLSTLNDEYIRNTPTDVLNFIADNRDKDYIVNIDENKALDNQNLSEETIAFIAMLKLDYWCHDEGEKEKLVHLLTAPNSRIGVLLKKLSEQ